MKEQESELIVERVRLTGNRYQLLEIATGWQGYFPTMQALQNHIEMWFVGYIVEWNVRYGE